MTSVRRPLPASPQPHYRRPSQKLTSHQGQHQDDQEEPERPPAAASGRLPLVRGTIKRLVRERGFGFIRDGGGGEYFFHRSVVEPGTEFDLLSDGDLVDFRYEQSAKGPRCGFVRLATGPE
ncbi:MAG TPA: cold shock domain-containing protein [Pseudonocardiaceae bacterium]|nr:cold shock domain-containing protein [Pseudonocardiaceae bacterium]